MRRSRSAPAGSWCRCSASSVGSAAALFSRIVILFRRGLPGFAGGSIARRPVAFAVLCGLGVALCGLVTGRRRLRHRLRGGPRHPARGRGRTAGFAPLKFAATVLSSISGIPGGLFAPSLAVGAGLGAHWHALFPEVSVGALVLIGMVAYLTGVLQAPITSFVIVTEMTRIHAMMIPLMATAMLAFGVSRLVCRRPLYGALARRFLAAQQRTAGRAE